MSDFPQRIPVGISSCLLGERVRFNGGHKLDRYIHQRLTSYFDFRPLCPEVAIGMGVPREPIRLVRVGEALRVQGVKDASVDLTQPLHDYGRKVVDQQRTAPVYGYIFKARSPSCGLERVKTYNTKGAPLKADGVGAFAEEILRAYPNLPVEEEGRLNDPDLRYNFLQGVFTYYRWRKLVENGLTPGALVAFHSRIKFTLLAHNQAAYRRLGKQVARAGSCDLATLGRDYEQELMNAMKRTATRKQHTNVLQHLQGYVSDQLDAGDRNELTDIIEEYRLGLLPLVAPLTLLRHHLRRQPNQWALSQTYLEPFPRDVDRINSR